MEQDSLKKKRIIFHKPKKEEKWMVSIRLPLDMKEKLKQQCERDYSGRSKQSKLVEAAVNYYLYTFSNINWGEYQKDLEYAELIDDIREGIHQDNLGQPTQVFFSEEIKFKILELEKKVKITTPLLKDVRTGLIRKALSIRLSLGSKDFFDSIMKLDANL